MRHKTTGKQHGIIRGVSANGFINDQTRKDGLAHGLSVWIWANYVSVSLNKSGQTVAYFHFDFEFNETERHDPRKLLLELTPASFMK